ncbi:hypothetical protein KPH14_002704 [Odynerus spinipes]|uniref:Uncharacterized protein n=1 Tax=Odynerus spinipes TaxID=1348599 RepID=A0AAD9VLH8_9HYME|nr:hypothetical protein KPH14_002704 [Odynerus spinipes]
MLHAVMLGSGPGRGRREWYPGFYLQSRRLGRRMNRGEQETLFRQSRQLTRIVPSHEDLVLSVLKAPINQQQQQQQQHQHHHQQQHQQQHRQHFRHHQHQPHSQEHHFNCQAHSAHRRCNHSGSLL